MQIMLLPLAVEVANPAPEPERAAAAEAAAMVGERAHVAPAVPSPPRHRQLPATHDAVLPLPLEPPPCILALLHGEDAMPARLPPIHPAAVGALHIIETRCVDFTDLL